MAQPPAPSPAEAFPPDSRRQGNASSFSMRYPLAVISARDARSTHLFLDQFELTPFFQVIVTGQTAEHTKPYPDPVLFAAQALKVPPESCLMVGDTPVDIRAGKTAGAQTVGVLC